MRFEQSIDIDAQQQRVWDVFTDLEAWPQRIETVDVVELLTPLLLPPALASASSNRSCQRASTASRRLAAGWPRC
ncbi:MAG: SRPBCC family protein [Chloroflexota bacterium]